jgi:hypothetical protein
MRKGIDFEVKVDGLGKFKGRGHLVLSTTRVVLINNKQDSQLKAFDLPLALISGEKFEQPILGANYWKGTSKPLNNTLPGNAHFKIWFMEGSFGKFTKAFRYCLQKIRENGPVAANQQLENEIQQA